MAEFDPEEFKRQLYKDFGLEPPQPEPWYRRAWDTATQPLKSIAGVTSGAVPAALFGTTETYQSAKQKAKERITKGEDRDLTTLEEAEALPGLGDVAVEALGESLPEPIKPIAALTGNILGDPLTYLSGGGSGLTKIGGARRALGAAQEALKGAEAAQELRGLGSAAHSAGAFLEGDIIPKASQALQAALGQAGPLQKGADWLLSAATPGKLGSALGEVQRGNVLGGLGRAALALPASPLVGAAYAPEAVEGLIGGARQTAESLRQGEYGAAALGAVNTGLMAGLNILMAKGLIDEGHARAVILKDMENHSLAPKAPVPRTPSTEATPTSVAPEQQAPAAPQPTQAAPAEPVVTQTAQAAPGAPVPEVMAPAPPAAPPVAPAAPQAATGPSEKMSQLREQVHAVIDRLEPGSEVSKDAIVQQLRAEGIELSGKDIKEKLPKILAEHEGLDLQGKGKARIKRVSTELSQAAPPPAPAGEATAPSPGPIQTPAGAPPPTPGGRVTSHAQVDEHLADPERRAQVQQMLEDISHESGVPIDKLGPEEIRTAFPGDENKATRAILHRATAGMRKEARQAPPTPTPEPPSTAPQPPESPLEGSYTKPEGVVAAEPTTPAPVTRVPPAGGAAVSNEEIETLATQLAKERGLSGEEAMRVAERVLTGKRTAGGYRFQSEIEDINRAWEGVSSTPFTGDHEAALNDLAERMLGRRGSVPRATETVAGSPEGLSARLSLIQGMAAEATGERKAFLEGLAQRVEAGAGMAEAPRAPETTPYAGFPAEKTQARSVLEQGQPRLPRAQLTEMPLEAAVRTPHPQMTKAGKTAYGAPREEVTEGGKSRTVYTQEPLAALPAPRTSAKPLERLPTPEPTNLSPAAPEAFTREAGAKPLSVEEATATSIQPSRQKRIAAGQEQFQALPPEQQDTMAQLISPQQSLSKEERTATKNAGQQLSFRFAPDSPAGRVQAWIPKGKVTKNFQEQAQERLQEYLFKLVREPNDAEKGMLERFITAPNDISPDGVNTNRKALENRMRGAVTSRVISGETRGKRTKAGTQAIHVPMTGAEGEILPAVEKAIGTTEPIEKELSLDSAKAMAGAIERMKLDPVPKARFQEFMTRRFAGEERDAIVADIAQRSGATPAAVNISLKLAENQLRYPGLKFDAKGNWTQKGGGLGGKLERKEAGNVKRFFIEKAPGTRAEAGRSLEKMVQGITSTTQAARGKVYLMVDPLSELDLSRTMGLMTGRKGVTTLPETALGDLGFKRPPLKRLPGKEGTVAHDGTLYHVYEVQPVDYTATRTVADLPTKGTLRKPSDQLTPEEMTARATQYEAALQAGTPIEGTRQVVADLDGDSADALAGWATRTAPVARAVEAMHDMVSQLTGTTSELAGLTPSAYLSGTRVGNKVVVNPAEALSYARRVLGPNADPAAINRLASRKLAAAVIHEIAHAGAPGHGEGYIARRAEMLKKIAPAYPELISRVESGLNVEALAPLADDFERRLNDARRAGLGGAEAGGPGPALGRTAAGEGIGAGGEGRALGGAGAGAERGGAVPGGPGAETGGVRSSPLARGAVPQGDEAAREAAGAGTPGTRVDDQVARYTQAHRQAAADYFNTTIDNLKDEELDKYLKAGPGEEVDIAARMEKFGGDAPPEVRASLAKIAEDLNKFQDRKTPLTWDHVDEGVLRMFQANSPAELQEKFRKSGIRGPVQLEAMRRIYNTYIDHISNMREAYNSAVKTHSATAIAHAEDDLGLAISKWMEAQHTLGTNTTMTARALGILRKETSPLTEAETIFGRFRANLRAQGVKGTSADELVRLLKKAATSNDSQDFRALEVALGQATSPTKLDKVLEGWKAGLLGYPTQVANMTSNALFQGLLHMEGGVSAVLDKFRSAITGKERERFLSEVPVRIMAQRKAAAEAFKEAGRRLHEAISLAPEDIQKRFDLGSQLSEDVGRGLMQGKIKGKTGEFIRLPFKFLDIADDLAKTIARGGEMAVQAHRIARKTGQREADILNEMWQVLHKPLTTDPALVGRYKNVVKKVDDYVLRATFQSPLGKSIIGKAAQAVNEFGKEYKFAQFIVPFTKTPANIFDETLARTPLGLASIIHRYRKGELKMNGELMDELAKVGVGTSVMGLAISAALDGAITGAGPIEPAEQESLKQTGWQPYALKLGDQYITYGRFEPLSSIFGIAADIGEGLKAGKHGDKKMTQRAIDSIVKNLTDKTFLSGLEGFFSFWHDPQQYGAQFVKQLQASAIPNVVGVVPVAGLARALDPKYRQTEALSASPFLARIPGASETLPEQLGPLGEQRERPGSPLERLLAPYQRTEAKHTPQAAVANEFNRLDWAPRKVEDYIKMDNGDKVYLTHEERARMAQARQDAIKAIYRVIQDPSYQRLPESDETFTNQTTKADVLKRIIRRHQNLVFNQIKPVLAARARKGEQRSEATL